jgi:transcriptional regulator GlxA family with amidase domain
MRDAVPTRARRPLWVSGAHFTCTGILAIDIALWIISRSIRAKVCQKVSVNVCPSQIASNSRPLLGDSGRLQLGQSPRAIRALPPPSFFTVPNGVP